MTKHMLDQLIDAGGMYTLALLAGMRSAAIRSRRDPADGAWDSIFMLTAILCVVLAFIVITA